MSEEYILSEEMIESIAEVNGYKFPDDFLTDADLREYVTKYELEDALAGIIDDDTTDYNSTWSSYKINEALSNVGTSYSTEEKIVGKWIDGTKDVYEKTFVIEPASPPMDWVGFFTVNMAALVSVEGHKAPVNTTRRKICLSTESVTTRTSRRSTAPSSTAPSLVCSS